MITIGTKLKSSRSGKIVEVVGLESGAKRVRLDDGSVKILNDANIARWYDEITPENKAETLAGTSNKMCQPKEKSAKDETVDTPAAPVKQKEGTAASSGAKSSDPVTFTLEGRKKDPQTKELFDEFLKFSKELNINLESKKVYNKGSYCGKGIFHFFVQNHKIRFEFREKSLTKEERALAVRMPVHFRRSYNHIIMVNDRAQLNRIAEIVERIIKEKK